MTGSWIHSYDLRVDSVKRFALPPLTGRGLSSSSESGLALRVALLVCGSLLLLACASAAPEFDLVLAQAELTEAFELSSDRPVALYSDQQATGRDDVWLVDFKVERIDHFMQARFVRGLEEWALDQVRPRPSEGRVSEWLEVGELLGALRAAAVEAAALTMERMEELSRLVEHYALLDASGRYPAVESGMLGELLRREGQVSAEEWEHDTDAWGTALIYHASPEGDVYILASPGSDRQWDESLSAYLRRTDERDLVGAGPSPDPRSDLILATGGWVQNFVPEG